MASAALPVLLPIPRLADVIRALREGRGLACELFGEHRLCVVTTAGSRATVL